ncbi:condensation domain-containing protein [Streptomyces sp. NPDC092296]|uniref:condensation domain-containing protein n=1 Tax=Streptomyces sp. NPDC092296 TaxID=3366012 RepID=UPI00380B22A2
MSITETSADRQQLALRLLAARRRAAAGAAGIPRVPRDGTPLECSAEQRRLWLAEQVAGPAAAPPVTAGLALHGPLDRTRLTTALAAVVDRHPVLRTRFAADGGEPVQLLPEAPLTADQAEALLDWTDLTPFPEPEREPLAQGLAVEAGGHRFDLAAGPLLRLTVLRLAPDEHRLLLICHHIAADAHSAAVLLEQLAAAHRDPSAARETTPSVPDYADYAAWSRRRLERVLPERLAYWRHRMAGAAPLAEPDLAPPRRPDRVGGRRTGTAVARIDAPTLERLRAVGGSAPLTAHTALLAGFAVLLARCAGTREVVVGAASGARPHPDLDQVVGCFTDLLPLRVPLTDGPDYRTLALRVRDTLAAALAHAAPFDRIVSAAAPRRAPGVHPLFQVLFVEREEGAAVLPGGPDTGWGPGLDARPWGREVDGTAYDLTLAATTGPDGAELVLTYPRDRFARAAATAFAGELAELLALLAQRPDAPVDTLRTAETWRAATRPHPAPRPAPRPAPGGEAGTAPPGAGPVAELRALWSEVLGRAAVGDHDDLFALGGDSLAVVRIAARIEERFGAAVPARLFFDTPTPAGFGAALARLIEEQQHA